MSAKTARRILWVAALFLVPVPLMAFTDAFVPTMRLLQLTSVILIVILAEGAHGVAALLFGLFALHTVLYAALLWLAARLLTGLLERLAPAALGWVTIALVALGLAIAVSSDIYDSPFHARLPHTSLLEVYE